MPNTPRSDPIETAKRHLRDCMESPDYPVHNCHVTCNDVAYLLAELERLERYALIGADYIEMKHGALGTSAEGCNDECIQAKIMQWAQDKNSEIKAARVERQ
jgi:hypothetical protein